MNENQAERLVVAFERLANLGDAWYKTLYPERKVQEAKITRVKTDEDELREDQGDTGEQSISEWTDIGRHEKDYLASQKVGQGGSED